MVWRRKRARRWRSMRKSSGSFWGAVREVRALILEGADAAPLVRDMQERIAVQFAAWAGAMAGSGGTEALRAALASVLGGERARIVAASVVPSDVKRVDVTEAAGVESEEMPHQERLL